MNYFKIKTQGCYLTYCLFVVLIFASQTLFGQFSKDYWHLGRVSLFSGETLRGRIKYDLENDLIQIQAAENVSVLQSLTPQKVEFFEFVDEKTQVERVFYSLPLSQADGYQKLVFFELHLEGKLTLLTRERIEMRMQSFYDPYYFGFRNYQVPTLIISYFVMDTNGKVQEFEPKRDSLLALMKDKTNVMNSYIDDYRLKAGNFADIVEIIKYYNKLR